MRDLVYLYLSFSLAGMLLRNYIHHSELDIQVSDVFWGLVLGIVLTLLTLQLMLLRKVLSTPRWKWDRNRKAIHLLRKKNQGEELTPNEQWSFSKYLDDGVIVGAGIVYTVKPPVRFILQYKLSDEALE